MRIKKGTLLQVEHCRKGCFKGVATRDFDTEKETFYPIAVAPGDAVEGLNTEWREGEEIPCRNTLCKVERVKEE